MVFTCKLCTQTSQVPVSHSRIWGRKVLPLVEEDGGNDPGIADPHSSVGLEGMHPMGLTVYCFGKVIEAENRHMDSKRQMLRPSPGWARRKKLPEVQDKPFCVSVIITMIICTFNIIFPSKMTKKKKTNTQKGRGELKISFFAVLAFSFAFCKCYADLWQISPSVGLRNSIQ